MPKVFCMSIHHYECACHSDEHTLKFTLDPGSAEVQPELFTSTFLQPAPFYKRFWTGVRYIFGYKCKYGHFDCFIMKPTDAKRMLQMLSEYDTLQDKYEKNHKTNA